MLSIQRCECACADGVTKVASNPQKTRILSITIFLLVGFFVTEWSVGLWSGSLSLQADAEHILSDVAALGISLLASWLAQKPATGRATFGHRRIEILAALANGLSLLVIALFICWEAIHHLHSPEGISGLPMLVVATIGLIVNLLNITLLHPHSHNDLNLRGALLHVIADTASSLGVILAAVAIHLWNWLWADAVISLFVAGFTGLSALPLLQESLLILLEYAPPSIDPVKVEISLKSFPQVVKVEKLRVWKISRAQVMLCAHITVDCTNFEESHGLLTQLRSHLQQSFGIHEVTLQLTNRKFLTANSIHPLFKQDLISML
ncbi:cation diffusion facilitator family transporter [Scytonema sp. UIC 10036]|uniref:cation diffusion facilitator family transporter n=1 Tax=Scytonema sp. UIC 10036 TaxID=2304196 RepID=UPI0012DAC250|nr:cation diffusion facilitator family transporter [Scytonema sp. UIC 10036]MUG98280.1 cation diffusion facilitator family transporter [Scytonema sp. UIC 10036]